MRKTILLFLFYLIYNFGFSQSFETILIRDNGPSDKRINLVVLGDGYDINEQDVFMVDAKALIDYLFTVPPFSYYSDYFNVYAIKVVSPESGVKHPGTATDVTEPVFPISHPNNYLETTFDYQDIHRCIYTLNVNKTTQVLATNVPFYDDAFVLVNSPEYGGCAGLYSYFSKHQNSNQILIHELGHSFSGLADEYWFPRTKERPNKTQDGNPETNPWRNWIGQHGVDIYPFEEDPSWYRPHEKCAMRYLGQPFCSVCSEVTIERIHELQGPIESFEPMGEEVEVIEEFTEFEVSLILPNPNYLDLSWELNDVIIDNKNPKISLAVTELEEGENTLIFSVVDNTPRVRIDNHQNIHINTITWIVNKGILGIDKIETYENSFVLYPNPTEDRVYVKSNKPLSSHLTYELITITGQLAKSGKINFKNTAVYGIELGNLPSQTYILNVYDKQSNKLFSQKIIKK